MQPFPVDEIRRDFPILGIQNRGKPLIYLDNAATTQRHISVIEATSDFYTRTNANVHRGIYELGERATALYEEARAAVARFINAPAPSIVFTRGTTESINLIANTWGIANFNKGDEILITGVEHHSNIVPWQLVAERTGAHLRYIPLVADGTLDLDNIDSYLTERTKLVSVAHQSNALGIINPVERIVSAARSRGILTVVDAAQSVPHMPVDIEKLGCDFMAFSGHKMLGPTGIGVLYGRRELLENMDPYQGGGEMIASVSMERSTWANPPHKFEAGTPNIAGAIGLGAAIDYLSSLGMETINSYLHELGEYAFQKLSELDFITIYGSGGPRSSVISFGVKNVHPHDLAQFLDEDGIAIRAGHHCAQPVMDFFNVPATARASFYIYNTTSEADMLVESLKRIYLFFNK